MTVLTFTVAQPLNANQRLHWAAKAKRTAAIRFAAFAAWGKAGRPTLERARCVATVQHRDRRRRDAANWSVTLKAAIDGLVQGGLLPDDDDQHLIGPDLRTDPEPDPTLPKGSIRVTLTFTPWEDS